jgi:hypothetical protein
MGRAMSISPDEGPVRSDEPIDNSDLHLDDSDLHLFDRIGGMYRTADPVPSELYTRVRFAFDLRNAERELATICAKLEPDLAVRGTEQTRTVSFEGESITITITITPCDGTFTLDGWLTPSGSLSVEVLSSGSCCGTRSDDHGRFVIENVPPGEMQIAVHPSPDGSVALSRIVVTQPLVL